VPDDKPFFRPWMRSPSRRRMSDFGPEWRVKAAINRMVNAVEAQIDAAGEVADRITRLEIEQRERDRAAADRLHGRSIRIGNGPPRGKP
jgi:hypothetical protein